MDAEMAMNSLWRNINGRAGTADSLGIESMTADGQTLSIVTKSVPSDAAQRSGRREGMPHAPDG